VVSRAPLPLGIVSTVSAASGGVVYVAGGKTDDKRLTNRVFVYVP
jgi:hypothetical protein